MATPGYHRKNLIPTRHAPEHLGGVILIERTTVVAPIHVPLWAWLVAAFAVLVVYSLTLANGAALANQAGMVHEFVHDARHLLGVPCH